MNYVMACLKDFQSSFSFFLAESEFPVTPQHQELAKALSLLDISRWVAAPVMSPQGGRPEENRRAICAAFVAKSVLGFKSTRELVHNLVFDITLRRICGFSVSEPIPSEATLSRAFTEFSEQELPAKLHEASIRRAYEGIVIQNISRDSTAIVAREKPVAASPNLKEKPNELPVQKELIPLIPSSSENPPAETPAEAPTKKLVQVIPPKKRGRPKKGTLPKAKDPTVLEQQKKILEDAPDKATGVNLIDAAISKVCNFGAKKDSTGNNNYWKGYKLHIDTADGGVPISCMITSASVHDSACALPLHEMSSSRVKYACELMDAAYDATVIHDYVKSSGKHAVIDHNPRRGEKKQMSPEDSERYKGRTAAERVNARMKDEFGARFITVQGAKKVFCHLMFGILALTADQLCRLNR